MEHPAQSAIGAGRQHDCARDRGKRPAGLPAANQLGRAMYSDLLLDPSAPPNFARHIFLDLWSAMINSEGRTGLTTTQMRAGHRLTPTAAAQVFRLVRWRIDC